MKSSPFFPLALVALLAAGCSTPTKVDKGPIKATSFSFVTRAPSRIPAASDEWTSIHAMIQDSISRNLANKGLTKKESGGDVVVAYLVIVGNNGRSELIPAYFGYGRDATALQDKAQKAFSDSKNPNYFEAGTLVVDIVDATTFKLLKRSYVVRPVLRNPTQEAQAERIQEAVDEVLKDLRVAH
jgi:hypothetical protein